jgi:hypothetical protein
MAEHHRINGLGIMNLSKVPYVSKYPSIDPDFEATTENVHEAYPCLVFGRTCWLSLPIDQAWVGQRTTLSGMGS